MTFLLANDIYESQRRKLVKANDKLIGKIKNELLFHNGTGERRLLDGSRMEKHNVLPNNIIKYFEGFLNNGPNLIILVSMNFVLTLFG